MPTACCAAVRVCRLAMVLAFALALAVWGVGCGGAASEPAPAAAGAGDGPRAGWPAELRLGLVPSEGGTDVVETFRPLAEHLSKSLGIPVRAISASSYSGVEVAMANDQVELAYFGPKIYVEARLRSGAEPLVIELNEQGEPFYSSVLVTSASSGITSLDEARGRTLAFTDANSMSGYLMPLVYLVRDRGVKPEAYFSRVIYSGSHGASVLAVKNGDVDVAATNTLDLGRIYARGVVSSNDLRVLWTSEPIPGSVFACRGELPESLKAALREAMLSFNENTEAMERMKFRGFAPASDKDFDPVRLMMEEEKALRAP